MSPPTATSRNKRAASSPPSWAAGRRGEREGRRASGGVGAGRPLRGRLGRLPRHEDLNPERGSPLMSILSIRASSLLAARIVRGSGGAMSERELLDQLEAAGMHDPLRRGAAIRHAIHAGRLVERESYPGAEGAAPTLFFLRPRCARPHDVREPDPLDFVHRALAAVARNPAERSTERDLALLAAIATGLNRRTAAATDELGALQEEMVPVVQRVERCRQASSSSKVYLRPALRARAAAADTSMSARRYTALANTVDEQSAAADLRVALAHDSNPPPLPGGRSMSTITQPGGDLNSKLEQIESRPLRPAATPRRGRPRARRGQARVRRVLGLRRDLAAVPRRPSKPWSACASWTTRSRPRPPPRSACSRCSATRPGALEGGARRRHEGAGRVAGEDRYEGDPDHGRRDD